MGKQIFLLILTFAFFRNVHAACGVSDRTWLGTTDTDWNTAGNWSGSDIPDSASENAIIVSGVNQVLNRTTLTVGCIDVQGGVFSADRARTITVTGDYFQAPFAGTLSFTSNNFAIEMAGSADQTFEAVDDIRDLSISNPTTVTLKNDFRIMSDLTITGTGTTNIEGEVRLNNTNLVQTIPAGHTVVIKSGGRLFSRGGLTISGTVQVEPGGELMIRNTETLTVASGGTLKILGSSGNAARVVSDGNNKWFNFDVAGTVQASYFIISRTELAGMNVTGTITQLDNGEFRGIRPDTGVGITLGAAASIPSTATGISFFNDDNALTPINIDASASSEIESSVGAGVFQVI